ncbi:MAG: hypothetical protein R3C52_13200 [Hyphomonadaceae bacterium]
MMATTEDERPTGDEPQMHGVWKPGDPVVKLTPEQDRARKRRSAWIAIGLFAFVILIFVITMTKLGANVLVRDL